MDRSYWLNRFVVREREGGVLDFEDRLRPPRRTLPYATFYPRGSEERLDIEIFRRGFLDAALPAASRAIAQEARDADDSMFWQFPCRTEAAAWEQHRALAEAVYDGSAIHVYLGLPWATWLDQRRNDASQHQARRELMLQRVRLSGFRRALAEIGAELRVHTVCQHVNWREMLPTWRTLGVTDAWLSHAPGDDDVPLHKGVMLHPWRLFAVNVEDRSRAIGLRIGTDPAEKSLLASFVGAHADHYLSDVRLRLKVFADEPGFHIKVTEKWHFEDVVYGHQVDRRPLVSSYQVDASVRRYNELLSDSVFSLCPAGAGANTLRLWESLAVGSVPVVLGPMPKMPFGGTLESIDWARIAIHVPQERLDQLPKILRGIPLEEVRERQRMAMRAFELVRVQRCF